MSEEEMEEILKKKREEIKGKRSQQEEVKKARKKRELEKQRLLRSFLSRKARERLARIKMAKPKLGQLIEKQVLLLGQRGAIKGRLSDEKLKELLKKINQRREKSEENKITFKRKGSSDISG